MISGGGNNYNEILHELSKSHLSSHIDKISLSIKCISRSNRKDLFSALKDIGFNYGYDVSKKGPKNMPHYKRIRQYRYNNSLISLFYKRKIKAKFIPHIWIVIQDPTREILHTLDALFNSFGFVNKVSQIELALDFPYKYKLHEFFWKHLFVRHNRGNPVFCGKGSEKSFYSGHKAKNCKTSIVYPKVIDEKKVLRLEVILNRSIIERLGLNIRMENINNIDLSEFLCFKEWNYDRFRKYLKWKNRILLSEINPSSPSLYMRTLIGAKLRGDEVRYVMPAIQCLKERGYSRPQIFFEDIQEVNNAFFNLLRNKKFL